MREFPIIYDEAKSVEENAQINAVSKWTIRKYIKENDVDRRADSKNIIIKVCRQYLEKHPQASRNEIHRETGYSLTTIRKYWSFISSKDNLVESDLKKAKRFQEKQARKNREVLAFLDRLPLDYLWDYLNDRTERELDNAEEHRKDEEERLDVAQEDEFVYEE